MRVEWRDVDILVRELERQIKKSNITITSIYGIPRGGLIPGVMLSHRLGLPLVSSLEEGSLVVDEISDSGRTLSSYKNPTVTLFLREGSKTRPTFYGEKVFEKEWLEFPWEV